MKELVVQSNVPIDPTAPYKPGQEVPSLLTEVEIRYPKNLTVESQDDILKAARLFLARLHTIEVRDGLTIGRVKINRSRDTLVIPERTIN